MSCDTSLTVAVARVQLLRRRLRRGEDPTRLETEFNAIETPLTRPTAMINRAERGEE